MYKINFFGFSSLLIIITSLLMGFLLLTRKPRNKPNTIFGFFCLLVSVWGFGGYGVSIADNENSALFWWKICSICIWLVPVMYFHFISSFFKLRTQKLILFLYITTTAYIIGLFFAYEIFWGSIKFAFGQFYWIYWVENKSPFFLAAYILLYVALLLASFMILFVNYLKIYGNERLRLQYLIIGTLVGWVGAESNFLVTFGFNIYPYLNILVAIYPLILGYAILKHKLFDIDIVLKKGLVYSTLALIITLVYLILVILAGKAFQGLSGVESFWMNLIIMLGIAMLFNPLRQKIQWFLDKRFFSGTLESLDQERQRLQQELYQKEKLAYVGQLASSVAHEIRNPLTSIKTFLEYLPQKYQDKEFREKFDQLIPKEINRIQGVVNNLLDLAKPKTPVLEKINICELLDLTLELLSDQMTLKKIQVKKEYENGDTVLSVDEGQMKQVFLNLFLNAIQAMDEGGEIVISVEGIGSRGKGLGEPHSNPHTLTPVPLIQITISDTGHGMSETQVKNLFTPFETTKPGGIGLGLVITKEIIRAHGGTIATESKLGQGTRFIIQLPNGK